MKVNILNLEWNSNSRDTHIIEPVLSCLEIKYGFEIQRKSISNYAFEFLQYKPSVFIISNGVGASENIAAVKLANKLGIKVITLISEGDYPSSEVAVKEFFWGWNRDYCFYDDLHLEWSNNNVNLIHKFIPNAKNFNIKVSGATGFDRYVFWEFMTKEQFCNKYKKNNYEHIIGIAGFAFNFFEGEYFKKFRDCMIDRYGEENIDLHLNSKSRLREIYERLIINNPNVLFILKCHPASTNDLATEFSELGRYENTVIIQGMQENIADIINVSDIWIAYESTTCLEAWMMNKPTMFVNPLGGEFKRSSVAQGVPIKISYEDAQEAINSFFKKRVLTGFPELEKERKKIISLIIQRDDGKNHIRAAKYIYDEITKCEYKPKILDLWVLKELLKGIFIYFIEKTGIIKLYPFRRIFYSILYLRSIFDINERNKISECYKKYLRMFYEKNSMESKAKT